MVGVESVVGSAHGFGAADGAPGICTAFDRSDGVAARGAVLGACQGSARPPLTRQTAGPGWACVWAAANTSAGVMSRYPRSANHGSTLTGWPLAKSWPSRWASCNHPARAGVSMPSAW